MADTKITNLAADTTPDAADVFPFVDVSAATTEKVTYANLLPAASATVAGKVELATDAETATGTDTVRAITPANAASRYAVLYKAATTQSGTTYTIAAGDHSTIVNCSNAGLVTVTLPTNASVPLTVGFNVMLFAAGAAGVTLTTTSLTLLGSSPFKTISQNKAIYCEKTATDTWVIIGGTSA